MTDYDDMRNAYAPKPCMPSKRCTSPQFKYTKSTETDIRKTFKRIRAEQKKAITK